MPDPTPEPEPELAVDEQPVRAPSIPLEERVRAPFAVQSEGRPVQREPRASPVVLDRPAPRAAATPAATPPAGRPAAPPSETATRPAAQTPAPPSAAPATPADRPRRHTVEVGETFYGIARLYGVTPAALAAVNPGVDGERLRAGQALDLPAYATRPASEPTTPTARAPAPTPPPSAAPQAGQQRTHRVASGETLWSIARRYGVTTEQIRSANRMTDDTVRLGQTLVIP